MAQNASTTIPFPIMPELDLGKIVTIAADAITTTAVTVAATAAYLISPPSGSPNQEGTIQSHTPPSTSQQGAVDTSLIEVHNNSHSTTAAAQGYSLRDRTTGEVLKYGETTQGARRYSQSYLDKNNARMVFEASGSKAAMYKWQHQQILDYRAQHDGNRPSLNGSDYSVH